MSTFYRVSNVDTNEGLWYDFAGKFTGDIHNKYTFCKCTKLEMPFDKELVGWVSAVRTLEELYQWFPKKDILKLQEYGYFISEYEAKDVKYYNPFEHEVIKQDTSVLVRHLVLEPEENGMLV